MKHVFVWVDVPTEDFDRAVKFYSTILGEEIKVSDMMGQTLGFFPMDPDGMVGGDIVPPSDEFKPSSQGTHVYLSCEGKIDDVLGRVENAGGKIIKPKFLLEGAGWLAMIQDSEGNVVGLHSSK